MFKRFFITCTLGILCLNAFSQQVFTGKEHLFESWEDNTEYLKYLIFDVNFDLFKAYSMKTGKELTQVGTKEEIALQLDEVNGKQVVVFHNEYGPFAFSYKDEVPLKAISRIKLFALSVSEFNKTCCWIKTSALSKYGVPKESDSHSYRLDGDVMFFPGFSLGDTPGTLYVDSDKQYPSSLVDYSDFLAEEQVLAEEERRKNDSSYQAKKVSSMDALTLEREYRDLDERTLEGYYLIRTMNVDGPQYRLHKDERTGDYTMYFNLYMDDHWSMDTGKSTKTLDTFRPDERPVYIEVNSENYQSFYNFFVKVRDTWQRWEKTAKENDVASFSKEIPTETLTLPICNNKFQPLEGSVSFTFMTTWYKNSDSSSSTQSRMEGALIITYPSNFDPKLDVTRNSFRPYSSSFTYVDEIDAFIKKVSQSFRNAEYSRIKSVIDGYKSKRAADDALFY